MNISLNGNDWQFKGYVGEDWRWRNAHLPNTRDVRHWHPGTVPGSVTHDLWQAGEIPNPYFERNSLLLEWIPARTWLYRKTFLVPEDLRGQRVELHFKGVDYEAQFFINGEFLGHHAGMYTPASFDVTGQLHYGAENHLAIVIEPAPHEQPQVGRTSLVRTHKARMNYWWDFCPRMVHQGIWDEVYLRVTGPVKIENPIIRPQLSDDLTQADVSITLDLHTPEPVTVDVALTIRFDGQPVAETRTQHTLPRGTTSLEHTLPLPNPHLWWPNGYGTPALYEAEIQVTLPPSPQSSALWRGAGGEVLDSQTLPFGIRRLRFLPNDTPDSTARPYTLEVNGQRMYINGWNWVPIDVLYGVERREKLTRLLTLAQRAHVNLLRVWGGGLIEKDAFYDLCDRLGILVWQEFIQSSSGIDNCTPDDPAMIAMMVHEAEQILPLKRNHPSLALWCGGNELQSGHEQPLDDSDPMLAALKEVVNRLDPDRFWLPTSSSGRLFSNSLENIATDPDGLHDVHGPWEHQGLTGQFTLYNQGTALLHSEFGVEGITNPQSLNAVIAPEHQWPVDHNNPYWFHLAAWWVKAPLWREVFGEFPDMLTAARALQFLQADGLRYAVEADRRRQWRCSGTLPWQFNEPYPNPACTSAVDYFAKPKPAYYAVAHAYEPVHVSAKFPRQAWEGAEFFAAEVFVSNARPRPVEGAVLRVSLVGASGKVFASQTHPVSFSANGTSPLASIEHPLAEIHEPIFFLDLHLHAADGKELSRNSYLFSRGTNLAPLLSPPPTTLQITTTHNEKRQTITITNTGPQTAFFVRLENPNAFFSDNHFCLFPDESRKIVVTWHGASEKEQSIEITSWNSPEQRENF